MLDTLVEDPIGELKISGEHSKESQDNFFYQKQAVEPSSIDNYCSQ